MKAFYTPYEKRVEVAIQSLCEDTRKAISRSWSKYVSGDSAEIEKILARSVQRLRNYSMLASSSITQSTTQA